VFAPVVAESVPTAGLRLQVMVLEEFTSVAVNDWVAPPAVRLAVSGVTEIEVPGLITMVAAALTLPAVAVSVAVCVAATLAGGV
jgi:hypothetical protein